MMHRRQFLMQSMHGFSGVALAAMLAEDARAAEPRIDPTRPYAPRSTHFAPKAKRVIEVFCSGALSHVDTFDFKPELVKRHGQPLPGNERLVSFQGPNGNLTKPLWDFKPRGQCGKQISDLVPHIGELADELCFFHSLTNRSNTHGPAENFMNTGFVFDGFPSMGAWINYALGSENQNLPAFVAIEDPRGMPQSGPNNWANGFLPAAFQGTPFSSTKPIRFLERPKDISAAQDAAARSALRALESETQAAFPGDANLAARIASYELAARMQLAIPEVADLNRETAATRESYGLNKNETKDFGRNCLMTRRLLEKGVRFVQLISGGSFGSPRINWDGHEDMRRNHNREAVRIDQPVAALIKDLKQRGMLEDTLILFTSEFGRTPFTQTGDNKLGTGRDHNMYGFSLWMAGGGVKGGTAYGSTDEIGWKTTDNRVHWYDFHATVLHLLGMDHERLTFYHNGIQRRLTNVHGHVIRELLA